MFELYRQCLNWTNENQEWAYGTLAEFHRSEFIGRSNLSAVNFFFSPSLFLIKLVLMKKLMALLLLSFTWYCCNLFVFLSGSVAKDNLHHQSCLWLPLLIPYSTQMHSSKEYTKQSNLISHYLFCWLIQSDGSHHLRSRDQWTNLISESTPWTKTHFCSQIPNY